MKNQREDGNSDLQRGFEPLRTSFALFVLLLGFAAAARAESGFGTIKAMARDGQPFELVALASVIHYQIGGLVAEASIRQRFSNSSNDWIEVHYLLPLPEGAAVPRLNQSNPKYQLASKVWRRMPLWSANLLGPWLVRNLP